MNTAEFVALVLYVLGVVPMCFLLYLAFLLDKRNNKVYHPGAMVICIAVWPLFATILAISAIRCFVFPRTRFLLD